MSAVDLPPPAPADLPPPTIAPSLPFKLSGFADEATARSVGDTVMQWLQLFSRFIDAERLEGVTIARDYDAALAALDRGLDGLAPLTRSTERAIGVAMTPTVIRNGELRKHLIMHAELAEALLDDEHENHLIAVYTLAHEMAHVHDLKMQDRAMPGVILKPRTGDGLDSFLIQMAEPCWNEYIACTLSARVHEKHIALYEETFLTTLQQAKEETDREILLFKTHRDVDRLMRVAVPRLGDLLKFAAYLIGHLHGIDGALEIKAPRAHAALRGSWFAKMFASLENALREMKSAYPEWPGVQVYEPLKDTVWGTLFAAGLVLTKIDDGRLCVSLRP